ncbi:hypothetical protein DSO57_1024729 [Entomophthora muscae]|uniref:Uncharacterized protein n=1 Tax=Entomophthora muscae TaxID=34485 RepID=A0ACC2UBL0_9FUNG|nr:hypothetical protein DSO57_1024729 [Entomophthora muscae]
MISTKPATTFQHQDELPCLPIPSLNETFATYCRSLQPLIKGDELVATEDIVIDFLKPGGLGEVLQERLKIHAKAQKNSWLEKWWLEYAYHRYRESTLINVNWYSLGKDDPSTPKPFTPDSLVPFSEFQIKRAAHLIHQFLIFWRSIEDQEIPPEFAGKSQMCMNQYRCMFGMSRIPQMECDKIQGAYPVLSDHITVFVKNHPYCVPVFDRASGIVYSRVEIERLLLDVINDVAKAPTSKGVCLLTAGMRDTWTQAREKLLEISPENSETLNKIQDSIFVVSLDDHLVKDDLQSKKSNLFHGNNANNRWLDAAISLIIDPSGSAGLNGEHSPLDALVPISVFDKSLKTPMGKDSNSSLTTSRSIKRMEFEVNQEIMNFIEEAKGTIKETIANSDLYVLTYSNYGANFIKKIAKTSPDAYIQMAIQLAYFNMYGKCVSTYESGSTRKFKHGRTDVIRTLSNESLAFCEAMADNSKDVGWH